MKNQYKIIKPKRQNSHVLQFNVKNTWLSVASGSPEELEKQVDYWEETLNDSPDVDVVDDTSEGCNVYLMFADASPASRKFAGGNGVLIEKGNYPIGVTVIVENGRPSHDDSRSFDVWFDSFINNQKTFTIV